MSKSLISEADLHAFVDAQSPAALRTEIEAYLATSPEDAARVRAYQAHNLALQELYNPVQDEPLPDALRQLAVRPATAVSAPDKHHWSLQRMAAGVVLIVFSGVAGWLAHGQYQSAERLAQFTPLARQAAIAHLVYTPDVRRPVEITGEHQDQLVNWLSKRLGTPVRAPMLGTLGFELVGGRLLPGNSGPVAQFMYQDASGQRLTLYVSTENISNHDTAFRFSSEGPINVFYWIDGKYGYALSASIDKGALARVASVVYEQLDHN
jgi:anti-sigma factor RsiW